MMQHPFIKELHDLRTIHSVGPAILGDLFFIGITSIDQLAKADAQTLFNLLETKSGHKQNICMLDLFHAIIHEARTGNRLPWHLFSAARRRNL